MRSDKEGKQLTITSAPMEHEDLPWQQVSEGTGLYQRALCIFSMSRQDTF